MGCIASNTVASVVIVSNPGDRVKDSGEYVKNSMGVWTRVVDCRNHFLDAEPVRRPTADPNKLYTDVAFTRHIKKVKENKVIEWKRPKEFVANPVLLNGETTRCDVKQGEAGTCYFLSVLALVADRKEFMTEILPPSAYRIEDPSKYDGVFHARFFQFGKWLDVYTDDYLPVIYENTLWGAKSPDKQNLWVALIEKALATIHGSYDKASGGDSGDVCLLLTGGVDERIRFTDLSSDDKVLAMTHRIQNALQSGSIVTCSTVDHDQNSKVGLVGDHFYSLLDVRDDEVKKTKEFKVRNPWGSRTQEDNTSNKIASKESQFAKNSNNAAQENNGEFYLPLADFLKYFHQIVISSLTPDFAEDGRPGSLKYSLNIYGEWKGNTAAGYDDELQNQRFGFTVTKKGLVKNEFVPFVAQIIQQPGKDEFSVRCDIFKILGENKNSKGHTHLVLEFMGDEKEVRSMGKRPLFRHKLRPGRYIIVASTEDKGQEKAFLLRLFTPAPLDNVCKMPMTDNVMPGFPVDTFHINSKSHQLSFEKVLFGEFISGKNAGGQVFNRSSYHLNPQYCFTIPKTGRDVPLVIMVKQSRMGLQYPIGLEIFKLDRDANPPMATDFLYNHRDSCVSDINGSRGKFINGWQFDNKFIMQPGRYLMLIYLDKPETEKYFCVIFRSTVDLNIIGFQTS